MKLNKEQIDAWEKELERQESFLLEHSWRIVENGWESPDGVFHVGFAAYDHLIDRLLLKKGWEPILLHSEVTFGINQGKITKSGFRQSPDTKRVYNFLEARAIYEGNLLEEGYPDNFNKFSIAINKALPNFTGKIIHVLYTKENGKLYLRLKDGGILYELK